MSLTRKTRIFIGIAGIILPAITLFIPFYESVLMSRWNFIPGLLYTYDSLEFEMAVIGGMGSLFAWVNIPVCILLSILLIVNQPNLLTVILMGILFLCCNALVFIGCSAGFGKPFGDTMLSGYYLLVSTELFLIGISLFAAIRNNTKRNKTAADF